MRLPARSSGRAYKTGAAHRRSKDPEDSSRDALRRLLGAGGDTTKADMQKIQHPSNNGVLGAPAGWDQGELPCNALPITRTHVGDLPAVLSYWRPDADELAALNAGGAVRLWVVGATMPPVILDVEIA